MRVPMQVRYITVCLSSILLHKKFFAETLKEELKSVFLKMNELETQEELNA